MKYFLVIDYSTNSWFDQFYGQDFKTALKTSLEIDPEMLRWSPKGLTEYGIDAEWHEKEKKWKFTKGTLDEYVDIIYKSYMSHKEIIVLDITDQMDVRQITL